MRALIVEDDQPLATAVREALAPAGFDAEHLADGATADVVLRGTQYDLLILDIGLPGLSGTEVLHRLRRRGDTLPVMFLTARDGVEDRVHGLNGGADDYLVKPFDIAELVARSHALVRRGRSASGSAVRFGPLELDMGLHEATLHDAAFALTGREWELVAQLVLGAPHIVTKARLVDSMSRWDHDITANAVEIYVCRLRAKLAGSGVHVRTVRGMGYRLELAAADAP